MVKVVEGLVQVKKNGPRRETIKTCRRPNRKDFEFKNGETDKEHITPKGYEKLQGLMR